MATHSRGPWSAHKATLKTWRYEVRNGRRDPIAVVYGNKADAELMARAPRLLGELKHLIPIVRMRESDLRASERAVLARARALVDELNH